MALLNHYLGSLFGATDCLHNQNETQLHEGSSHVHRHFLYRCIHNSDAESFFLRCGEVFLLFVLMRKDHKDQREMLVHKDFMELLDGMVYCHIPLNHAFLFLA